MARIRSVKPTFWGDEKIAQVSRDARLLMLGIISLQDDEGRFLGSPSAIQGYVFPNDELPPAKVKRWLSELDDIGLIHLYTVNGVTYGCVKQHQRISHPQASTLPPPPLNGSA